MNGTSFLNLDLAKISPGRGVSVEFFYKGDKTTMTDGQTFIQMFSSGGDLVLAAPSGNDW